MDTPLESPQLMMGVSIFVFFPAKAVGAAATPAVAAAAATKRRRDTADFLL
jgi:hypothetical protein